MSGRHALAALGMALLAGCARHDTVPGGAVAIDETVALTRGAQTDSATRELAINEDSIVIAFVDEALTDVKVKLATVGPDKDSIPPVEVENNLKGAGLEVAALDAPKGLRVMVTLTGPPDNKLPGQVRLRVLRYPATAASDAAMAARIEGLHAWSRATNATLLADAVKRSAVKDMEIAIARLNSPHGDAALSAMARMVRANMFLYHEIDWREGRNEAVRAQQAFHALATPDVLNEARARLLESTALIQIAMDRASVDPTSEEAAKLARQIATDLAGEKSPFGKVERAGAFYNVAYLELNGAALGAARISLERSLALYREAGNRSGERGALQNLGVVLGDSGEYDASARAYDALLPQLAAITDPQDRSTLLLNAARAESFSGRSDQAIQNLLAGLKVSRDFKLRANEGRALQSLGHLYANRGDFSQAESFYVEALTVAREQNNGMDLVYALHSNGVLARRAGDHARALALHREAELHASNPVPRIRVLREIALDYSAAGDYPAAIAELRKALAVKLENPRHHARTDLKINLASLLIEHGGASKTTLAEAGALSSESLKECIEASDVAGEIAARRVLAQVLAAKGKPAEAREEYERTFALLFKYRSRSSSPELQAGTLAHEQAAFRGYVDLLMTSVAARGAGKLTPVSKSEEDALRLLELARAANFGTGRTARLDAESTAHIEKLMAQLADKKIQIAALVRDPQASQGVNLQALQLSMANLRAEADRVRAAATAKTESDLDFATLKTQPWPALSPTVVQLSYALGNEHVYAWVRTSKGIVATVLAASPATLERELTNLMSVDRQQAPAKVEQGLARVSGLLMPAGLLPDDGAVEIVAEGRIASVPFAGLRSPSDANHRLVETHAITMIVSMFDESAPAAAPASRPLRLVALASGSRGSLRSVPVEKTLPALQAATAEARAIADLFAAQNSGSRIKLLLGGDGTAEVLRGIWGGGADVVHFATHGLADLRQPLASLLMLPAADAAGAPTYLTAGQVQEWHGDAELVFLSACDTAVGPARFAEGMPGLQRAFLRAGARGVVATLWPVEDGLAREFAADFYKRFTDGKPAVQALHETQREWLTTSAGGDPSQQIHRRITALAHAFYAQ